MATWDWVWLIFAVPTGCAHAWRYFAEFDHGSVRQQWFRILTICTIFGEFVIPSSWRPFLIAS